MKMTKHSLQGDKRNSDNLYFVLKPQKFDRTINIPLNYFKVAEQQSDVHEMACSNQNLTSEVNRIYLSFGQRQEQSGRLACISLCLGV